MHEVNKFHDQMPLGQCEDMIYARSLIDTIDHPHDQIAALAAWSF